MQIGPIVLACDEAYAMPLATTLRSAVETNRDHWPLLVTVLVDAVNRQTLAAVEGSLPKGAAVIEWVSANLPRFADLKTPLHVSRVTYARLMLPEVFAQEAGRLLYLDADTLVLGDLEKLW